MPEASSAERFEYSGAMSAPPDAGDHPQPDDHGHAGHGQHGLLAAGEAGEERLRLAAHAGDVDGSHQTGILMISWNDSTALLRTATVSCVISWASVAATM